MCGYCLLYTSGAGELIADKIVGLLGADPNPIVLLLVIFIVTCALTNFMSNKIGRAHV